MVHFITFSWVFLPKYLLLFSSNVLIYVFIQLSTKARKRDFFARHNTIKCLSGHPKSSFGEHKCSSSCDFDIYVIMMLCHVRNNIFETYPRRIGQVLNDVSCVLGSMLSSFMGLPNPTWVSLVVSHMAHHHDIILL